MQIHILSTKYHIYYIFDYSIQFYILKFFIKIRMIYERYRVARYLIHGCIFKISPRCPKCRDVLVGKRLRVPRSFASYRLATWFVGYLIVSFPEWIIVYAALRWHSLFSLVSKETPFPNDKFLSVNEECIRSLHTK